MIVLPFPSSAFSGHAKGSWYGKCREVKAARELAAERTKDALPILPAEWDIPVHVRFVPPTRQGDRINFPNRMKPYFDGIADALGVNDVRFLPSYEFCAPEKPGRVEVFIPANQPGTGAAFSCCSCGNVPQIERPGTAASTASGADHSAIRSSTDGS